MEKTLVSAEGLIKPHKERRFQIIGGLDSSSSLCKGLYFLGGLSNIRFNVYRRLVDLSNFIISERGPNGMVNALDHRPDLGAPIASLIASFNSLEMYLPDIYSAIAAVPSEQAAKMFSVVRSFAIRRDMVVKALETSALRAEDRNIISGLLGELKQANALRNKYAHAVFSYGANTQSITMMPYFSDRNQKPREETVDLESVSKDRKKLGELHLKLLQWWSKQTRENLPEASA